MKTKHLIVVGDARRMHELEDNSIQLIVTSPPYFNVKDYGNAKENVGAINNYLGYIQAVSEVFKECYRILENGRCICVNVSDIISAKQKYPIPFHLVPILERAGFQYRDDIIWKKPSGVGQNAGSGAAKRFGVFIQNPYPMYYYPNNIYEHLLIFRKGSFDYKQFSSEEKQQAKLDLEFAKEHWNSDVWEFTPETKGKSKEKHPAMFPEELPEAVIKLFTYEGERVLDPFLGSGTTMKVARKLNRFSVGYEINPSYLQFIRQKVGFNDDAEDVRVIFRSEVKK
ncbi:MAG: site-specific DNA-methyltransferase [Thaumarchaeota archaeon]|nr:site-specific DNA-methyltransferase [Nitrososphaerota archaeon]